MNSVVLTALVKASDWDLFVQFMKSNFNIETSDMKMTKTFSHILEDQWDPHKSNIRGIITMTFSDLSLASFYKLAYGERMTFNAEMETQ